VLLLAINMGSGIMGEPLAGGNAAIALLANRYRHRLRALRAHRTIRASFDRAFQSRRNAFFGERRALSPAARADIYIVAQTVAAFLGAALVHITFSLPLFSESEHRRRGAGQWVSEAVATAGLLLTIGLARREGAVVVGGQVATFIASACWFTASTSFANPAVTLAPPATNTFAGSTPSTPRTSSSYSSSRLPSHCARQHG
jgi:hypothetical protein